MIACRNNRTRSRRNNRTACTVSAGLNDVYTAVKSAVPVAEARGYAVSTDCGPYELAAVGLNCSVILDAAVARGIRLCADLYLLVNSFLSGNSRNLLRRNSYAVDIRYKLCYLLLAVLTLCNRLARSLIHTWVFDFNGVIRNRNCSDLGLCNLNSYKIYLA